MNTRLVRSILVLAGLVTIPLGGGLRLSASPVPQNDVQSKVSQETVQMPIGGDDLRVIREGSGSLVPRDGRHRESDRRL